jgi:hypothetical protein
MKGASMIRSLNEKLILADGCGAGVRLTPAEAHEINEALRRLEMLEKRAYGHDRSARSAIERSEIGEPT